MKLWADGKPGSAGTAIRATVKDQVENINRKVVSRGVRAVNALRNAELEVLKGQRSGKVYRKPFSKATYTASAPGEPPARRTGNLRLHWNGQVKVRRHPETGCLLLRNWKVRRSIPYILKMGKAWLQGHSWSGSRGKPSLRSKRYTASRTYRG